jgi:(carboxyethyl)arginine beta-lactam-synthase
MGTDLSDEFPQAALVARHLGSEHSEIVIPAAELLPELSWAVWAAETADHTILEYLIPLVALYRRLAATSAAPQRILTGYGADIPLGGMHRTTTALWSLDSVIAYDMARFDGLNEMTPVLSGMHGMWSTHPYWDREVLDLLVRLDPGLKHRHGRDKWVLRQSLRDLLPARTVNRPKLGVHESSGTTSAWTALLTSMGVPDERVEDAKCSMARHLFQRLVLDGGHPAEIPFDDVLRRATRASRRAERQTTV